MVVSFAARISKGFIVCNLRMFHLAYPAEKKLCWRLGWRQTFLKGWKILKKVYNQRLGEKVKLFLPYQATLRAQTTVRPVGETLVEFMMEIMRSFGGKLRTNLHCDWMATNSWWFQYLKKSGRQQSNVSLWWIATVERNYTTWTCFFCCPFQLFGWCLLVFQIDSSWDDQERRTSRSYIRTQCINSFVTVNRPNLFLAWNYPVTLDFFWRWVMILSVDWYILKPFLRAFWFSRIQESKHD